MPTEQELSTIREIAQNIKDGLKHWSDILIECDATNASFYMDFSAADIINATHIFMAVAQNAGIKAGRITDENATRFGEQLRQQIVEMTGVDPVEFYKH